MRHQVPHIKGRKIRPVHAAIWISANSCLYLTYEATRITCSALSWMDSQIKPLPNLSLCPHSNGWWRIHTAPPLWS